MRQTYIPKPILLLILMTSLLLPGCSEAPLTIRVQFPEVSGLKQDDQVLFERNEIGQVKKVTYTNEGYYLVEVEIAPEFKNAATEDSTFYIERSPTRASAMAVIVEQDRPGGMLLKNDVIVQGHNRSGYFGKIFDDLKKQAGKAESELNKSLEKIKKSFDTTSEKLDRDLETAIGDLSVQLDSFKEELGKIPDSKEVQQIEESLRQFADEFQKAQKDVQDQIRNEILPRLNKELDQLREQLRKEGREKELDEIDKQAKELDMV